MIQSSSSCVLSLFIAVLLQLQTKCQIDLFYMLNLSGGHLCRMSKSNISSCTWVPRALAICLEFGCYQKRNALRIPAYGGHVIGYLVQFLSVKSLEKAAVEMY